MRVKMLTLIISLILVILLIAGAIFLNKGLHNWFIFQPKDKWVNTKWIDMGPTPEGENKYTPQGLTWVNGHLLFANSWKDTRSRVYKLNPKTMKILATFDMPEDAVHTSGLAWDGNYLWGVDYISNRAYKIDMENSFQDGKVHVLGSFDTTLKGTSASSFIEYKGEKLLCISDFMRTNKNIIIRQEDAINSGTAKDNIVYTYKNDGFPQGLEFDGTYIYESENKIGVDVIYRFRLEDIISNGNAREVTIVQYNAPSKGVEDLAWDGEYFWTSDETTFRFYKTKLPDLSY